MSKLNFKFFKDKSTGKFTFFKEVVSLLNLTKTAATSEELKDGVVDLPKKMQKQLNDLLTFEKLPSILDLEDRANKIYNLALDADPEFTAVVLNGEPFFMGTLESHFKRKGKLVFYSFTERVKDKCVHKGFIKV